MSREELFNVVSTTAVAWSLSAWFKAAMILQKTRVQPLSLATTRPRQRQLLAAYHMLTAYVFLRALVPKPSVLVIARALAWVREHRSSGSRGAWLKHRGAALSALMGLVCFVDELLYLAASSAIMRSVVVRTRPLPRGVNAAETMCCVCHVDAASSSKVRSFCPDRPHYAHAECVTAWYLSDARGAGSCPLCRRELQVERESSVDAARKQLASGKEYWQYALVRAGVTCACVGSIEGVRTLGTAASAVLVRIRGRGRRLPSTIGLLA